MPQGSGIGGNADYGERGGGGAVEEGESVGMGAEGKWDKGEGGGSNAKNVNNHCKNSSKRIEYTYRRRD